MSDGSFRAHTGKRKRPIGAKQIESFEKRRHGTVAERKAAAGLYAPPSWWCDKCAVEVYERCKHCGKSETERN